MPMNILEKYIEQFHGIIIYVSGLSGCGKTQLVNNLSHDLKLKVIDQKIYYKTPKKITLSNGSVIDSYDNDDAIDWEKMSADINKAKPHGIIVNGTALIRDKLPRADFHIHVSVKKQKCIELRRLFLSRHKERFGTEFDQIGTDTESLKMKKIVYPYYLDTLKRSKIDKFINANDLTADQIYDIAFDELMEFIDRRVYNKEKKSKVKFEEEIKEKPLRAKEESKEEPKEEPKEESKEPKEKPKEESKEPKEESKEESKEEPKEESKEEPKEEPKEELREKIKEEDSDDVESPVPESTSSDDIDFYQKTIDNIDKTILDRFV